jgi:hypothetical protein
MLSTQPQKLMGRYTFVVFTVIPARRANGAQTNAVGKKSTAEWIGDAP